jgi:ABC-2 type transport system permease protein
MPIYDQTFRHYDGPRRYRALWWPIAQQTVRPVLKARLTWVLLIGMLGIVIFISMALFGLAKVRDLDPQRLGEIRQILRGMSLPIGVDFKLNSLLHAFIEWTGIFQWLLVLMAQGAISSDKKHNALPLYFSRPLTRRDYITGKVLGLALLPATAVSAGLLLIFVQAAAYLPNSLSYAVSQMPALLLALMIACFKTVSIAMTMAAISSVTSNSRAAGLMYIGFWLGSNAVAVSLTQSTRESVFAALSPDEALTMLSATILRADPELFPREAALTQFPWPLALVSLGGVLLLSAFLIRRNLRVVEVVT